MAILKVNSDRGFDYIENFVPFAAECMRKSAGDVVSLDELQNALRSDFGLDIDHAPLRTILDRVVKSGFATREKHSYVKNRKALEALTFADTRETTVRQVNALVELLTSHSGGLLPIPWTQSEAEAALLNYLASRGTSVLAASAAEIPIAIQPGGVTNAEYVLASFIAHLHREDPAGFDFLIAAVKGSVLASVLYFDDFGSIARHFDHLDVYLDTVVLIHGLGLVGPEQQTATLETLTLARQLGARLWCFTETIKEVDGVLTFASNYVRNGQRHDIPIWGATEYLVKEGKTASDIDLIAAHLERDLRGIGVGVRDRPPPREEWTIDEDAFAKHLRASVRYRADAPLQHDLDAVTAIHRLRFGQAMPKLEASRAMFVTTNTPLARATTTFFREEYSSTSFAPLCMPVHQFGTLAWLKKPLGSPELPTKFVLADALAALDPPPSVWKEYVNEIGRLESSGTITVEDCYLLRYSPAAKEALMGITIGGSRAFLQGSVPEILARVRSAERRDAEAEAASQKALRESAQVDAAASMAEAQQRHEADLENVQGQATAVAEATNIARHNRLANYRKVGQLVGRISQYLLLGAYILLVVVQAYGLSPVQPIGALPSGWANPLFAAGLAVAFAIGVVLSLTGHAVLPALDRLRESIAERVAYRLESFFEGGDSTP